MFKTNAYLERIRVVENVSKFLYVEKYKWENQRKKSQVNLGGEREIIIKKVDRNIFMSVEYR
jgi:hypothetical protein